MPEREKTFAPGERISIGLNFVCEDGSGLESVEAVFAQEGSDGEIRLLGDAERASGGADTYSTRLAGEVGRGTAPGEYRCVRLTARDRFDDDRDFVEAARLDLVVRVKRSPSRLVVTRSDFL